MKVIIVFNAIMMLLFLGIGMIIGAYYHDVLIEEVDEDDEEYVIEDYAPFTFFKQVKRILRRVKMSKNIGPFTIHFDIRNGDVSASYDEKGNFLFADVIKCGEWYSYTDTEEKDFLEEMDYYCIDLEEKKNEYIEDLKNIIETCSETNFNSSDSYKRYLNHLRGCIDGLNKISLRKETI